MCTHTTTYITSHYWCLSEGSDYLDPGIENLEFSPENVRPCVTIEIINDDITEPMEYFEVNLSDGTNVATCTINITDDDNGEDLNCICVSFSCGRQFNP